MRRSPLSSTASTGLEASLMGLTMAGCIGLGYVIGNWLDGRFGTTFWMPVMVILGIIAGAREMWVTFVRIRESFSKETFDGSDSSEDSDQKEPRTAKTNRAATGQLDHRKPRFFHVPPPPLAGEQKASEETAEREESLEEQLEKLRQLQQEIEAAQEEDASDKPRKNEHESE